MAKSRKDSCPLRLRQGVEMNGAIGKDIAAPTAVQNSLTAFHPSWSGTRNVSTSQAAMTPCQCVPTYLENKLSASFCASHCRTLSPCSAERAAATSLLLARSATTCASSASLGDGNPDNTLFRRPASCVHRGPASRSASARVAMSSWDKRARIALGSSFMNGAFTKVRKESSGCGSQSCCWAACCSGPVGTQVNCCAATRADRLFVASENGTRTLSDEISASCAFDRAARSCAAETWTLMFSARTHAYASCTTAGETDTCPLQMDVNKDDRSS